MANASEDLKEVADQITENLALMQDLLIILLKYLILINQF